MELRGREGLFRAYFPGSVWLEEGYAYVDTPAGEVRVGKVGSVVGLADQTFGGDLFSLNGVNRNPDWGVQIVGSRPLGWHSIDWAARWAGQNDHVAWEEEGKGVESDPSASSLRDGLRAGYPSSTTRGSGAVGRVVGRHRADRPERRTDRVPSKATRAPGLTGTLGPLSLEFQGSSGRRTSRPPARSGPSPSGTVARGAGRSASSCRPSSSGTPTAVALHAPIERDIRNPQSPGDRLEGVEATLDTWLERIRPAIRPTFNAFWFGLVVRFPFGDVSGAVREVKG